MSGSRTSFAPPSTKPARRAVATRRWVVTAAVLSVLVLGAWALRPGPSVERKPLPAPWQVSVPQWESLLTGDADRDEETYTALAQVHPGLSAAQAAAAGEVAADVLRADLTTQGREAWATYWPPAPTTGVPAPTRCSGVSVLATSPAAFEVVGNSGRSTLWVKTLVAYTGNCASVNYTTASPGVEYIYLAGTNPDQKTSGAPTGNLTWVPIREWNIPQEPVEEAEGPGDLPEWQLTRIGPCGLADDTAHRMRTLATDAFAQMCQAASDDGVVLVVESAYRSRAEQAALFARAVEYYGSVEDARDWVAYADESICESKHCAGTAVNVEPDNAAVTWLNTVISCATTVEGQQDFTPSTDGSCPTGATGVKRSQTFGFVAPLPRIPGYLEFVLPTGDPVEAVPDCSPTGVGVDAAVASVFRYRLARENVPPAQIEQVTAEAMVISRCASSWNASARVFGGTYAATPHPDNGRLYTEAGVFALRSELVETGWVDGDVLDATANINAAASLWLATRGWEQFPCATGTDEGLPAGPVLPAYGGPDIPAWATDY